MPVKHPKAKLPVVLKILVVVHLGFVHDDATKVDVRAGGDEVGHRFITGEAGLAHLAPLQLAGDAMRGLNGSEARQDFRALVAGQPQPADDHVTLMLLALVPALIAVNAHIGIRERAELRLLDGGGVHDSSSASSRPRRYLMS